jgi:hypothetical protein
MLLHRLYKSMINSYLFSLLQNGTVLLDCENNIMMLLSIGEQCRITTASTAVPSDQDLHFTF